LRPGRRSKLWFASGHGFLHDNNAPATRRVARTWKHLPLVCQYAQGDQPALNTCPRLFTRILPVWCALGYHAVVRLHQQIDARALLLAHRVADRIEADPARVGVEMARQTCQRWLRLLPPSQHTCVQEWCDILKRPWSEIRSALLDPGERGARLRQNSPFCGVLCHRERWAILREFNTNEPRAA